MFSKHFARALYTLLIVAVFAGYTASLLRLANGFV